MKDVLGKPFLFYTVEKSITLNEDNLKKFRPRKIFTILIYVSLKINFFIFLIYRLIKILLILDFNSRDNKLSFDSIVSINFDEERKSQFSLKSEYITIFELLSLYSSNIENTMKQLIFNKSIFKNYENPNPEKLYLILDGVSFEVSL